MEGGSQCTDWASGHERLLVPAMYDRSRTVLGKLMNALLTMRCFPRGACVDLRYLH